jgi:hypothetical protein
MSCSPTDQPPGLFDLNTFHPTWGFIIPLCIGAMLFYQLQQQLPANWKRIFAQGLLIVGALGWTFVCILVALYNLWHDALID